MCCILPSCCAVKQIPVSLEKELYTTCFFPLDFTSIVKSIRHVRGRRHPPASVASTQAKNGLTFDSNTTRIFSFFAKKGSGSV